MKTSGVIAITAVSVIILAFAVVPGFNYVKTKVQSPAAAKDSCVAGKDEICPNADFLGQIDRIQALNDDIVKLAGNNDYKRINSKIADDQAMIEGIRDNLSTAIRQPGSGVPSNYKWDGQKKKFVLDPNLPVPSAPAPTATPTQKK